MNEQKIRHFINDMKVVLTITDSRGYADESGVLIGEAKRFPYEALEACKRHPSKLANKVKNAVTSYLQENGMPLSPPAIPQGFLVSNMPVSSPATPEATPSRKKVALSEETRTAIENLTKPSRSKAYKTAFSSLKAQGNAIIPAVLSIQEESGLPKYGAMITELMTLLAKIDTPESIATLRALRTKGATVAVQNAALRALQSIGQA